MLFWKNLQRKFFTLRWENNFYFLSLAVVSLLAYYARPNSLSLCMSRIVLKFSNVFRCGAHATFSTSLFNTSSLRSHRFIQTSGFRLPNESSYICSSPNRYPCFLDTVSAPLLLFAGFPSHTADDCCWSITRMYDSYLRSYFAHYSWSRLRKGQSHLCLFKQSVRFTAGIPSTNWNTLALLANYIYWPSQI